MELVLFDDALEMTLRWPPFLLPRPGSSSSVSTTPESRGSYFLGKTSIFRVLGESVFSVTLITNDEFAGPLKTVVHVSRIVVVMRRFGALRAGTIALVVIDVVTGR